MGSESTYRTLFRLILLVVMIMLLFFHAIKLDMDYSKKLNVEALSTASSLLSSAGLFSAVGGYFLWYFNTEAFRPRFFYELLYFISGVCLVSALKLLYAQPRPYMFNPAITPFECELDYGMPSGHSFTAAMISVLVWRRFREKRHPS